MSHWLVNFAEKIGNFHDRPEPGRPISGSSLAAAGSRLISFSPRRLKPGSRPVAEADNPKVIVSPADSTFDEWADIKDGKVTFQDGTDEVKLKGIFLENDGVFIHAFLSTKDYHREHTVVAGKVLEVKNIQKQVYLEAFAPAKPWPQTISSRDHSRLTAQDTNGVRREALIVIDAGPVGLVAFLPIGMAQVSSVVMTATVGSTLAKGEDVSYFQFGGSDIVVVFQNKVQFEKNIEGKRNKFESFDVVINKVQMLF
ncbi:hypothetical protein XA68_11983 [Ophiocordyceps unilateralis]|uniref:Phosphatidylserine decarboxylase n=1 Tax=Ophiocordyceps unilateralis TaxID=268505 RepID=A0A2A9PPF9_OPHUN|nr:hypothetical protein XA68_11983 [Ophiocordyceps unilateralis]